MSMIRRSGPTVSPLISNAELADLYEAAADYIEVHGWARGELRTRSGEVCLSGALCTVALADARQTNTDAVRVCRWQIAMDRLAKSAKIRPHHPVTWNDTIATDQYEVIDALRDTAKELRNA